MRTASRAIIIRDGNLLVMHRNKFGLEYDTLPGGNVELGETPEAALYREVQEETTVQFQNPRLIIVEHAGQLYGDQYIYVCEYVSGEPKLHPDSEEALISKMGQNLYNPMWVPVAELPNKPFVSEKLKDLIISMSHNGWPDAVVEIN